LRAISKITWAMLLGNSGERAIEIAQRQRPRRVGWRYQEWARIIDRDGDAFAHAKSNSVVAVRHNPTPTLHLANLNGRCIGIFFRIKAARQGAHEHELRPKAIYQINGFHYYKFPFLTALLMTVRLTPPVR
jgi:hypothetical protein